MSIIDNEFNDVRKVCEKHPIYHPADWEASQKLATKLRRQGSNGIVYRSVRHSGGECIAFFWPDVIEIPIEGRKFAYHFDGQKVDLIRDESSREIFRLY